MKGHWPKGKARNDCADGAAFWDNVLHEYGIRPTAHLLDDAVSPRTLGKWASGLSNCKLSMVQLWIDKLIPMSTGSLPIYNNMAIDGNTRVGGVGEYTIQSAKGNTCLWSGE